MSVDAVGATDPPKWFTAALTQVGETTGATVRGVPIAVRRWGVAGPGMVLIHGGGANAHWWDHIAPLLATRGRVAALDLSGHGDSGRRAAYDYLPWAEEAVAAARACSIERPVLVGHSLGGLIALTAAREHPAAVGGVIALDTPVPGLSPEEAAAIGVRTRRLHEYPSAEAAVARFRTVPDDPWVLPYVVAHVARESVRRVDEGWTWKFDPAIYERDRSAHTLPERLRCRALLIRAEFGLEWDSVRNPVIDSTGSPAPVRTIDRAGHHVILDRPLEVVDLIQKALDAWSITE